ncbi:MAG: AMP-binding protein [Desulfomonilaceae bacterium]
MAEERIWWKSYGVDLKDLDPKLFEVTLTDLMDVALKKHPEKPALIFMGHPITFGQFDELGNKFANMLLAHGFKKGDVVGINLPNIPEYLIAWLGTLRAGCVCSGLSPLLSSGEMEHQLRDSKAKGLVTLDVSFEARVTAMAPRLPDLALIVAANVGGFLPKIKQVLGKFLKKLPSGKVTKIPGKTVYEFKNVIQGNTFSPVPPSVKITPDDVAYLMYTGGTTGVPKGAMLTHRNNAAEWLVSVHTTGWDKNSGTVLSGFPMFHIAGLAFSAISLYVGWTQILVPDPRNTDFICSALEKYKPFLICNVPSLYYALMSNPKFKKIDHSNITQCVSAASPFPEEFQRQLESIVGPGKLIELYGMTELCGIAVINPVRGIKKLGSVGIPLTNTDIKLMDPSSRTPVKGGEAGELWIKSPMVMKGYFNNPEETRKALDEDGYMHTGDVMVQDADGYLSVVDRTKDMMIVSGFKVFSTKVESILARHEAVEAIATVGVPNPEKPGSELVKAFVVVAPHYRSSGNKEAIVEDLAKFAKAHLAPFEAPKLWEIVDQLPLTSVGKIDKKVLRQQARK